ncbi:MAG: indole-3-glycerol phosphate synthase TrpC [Saprospiraceae bacterium]|nr:indole-3-glycerol phosphate synthase TrpC [Saprospiraceae bacterium]
MKSSILNKIVLAKREEVSFRKEIYSEELLTISKYFSLPCRSLTKQLSVPDSSGIIAEIKRKSPSKGDFRQLIHVPELAKGYESAGSSALSVLTDSTFFGGMNEDLEEAKSATNIPILRKEFIIDAYQIVETKSIGADAILLIAAILSKDEIQAFTNMAQQLGMEVLLEVHSREELRKIPENIDLIGVNNRDLKTFETILNTSKTLIPHLPESALKISESGIRSAEDIQFLRSLGFRGFLIGEHFMSQNDPAQACKELIQSISLQIPVS